MVVLIVAECNVNNLKSLYSKYLIFVLIVAECNVNLIEIIVIASIWMF